MSFYDLAVDNQIGRWPPSFCWKSSDAPEIWRLAAFWWRSGAPDPALTWTLLVRQLPSIFGIETLSPYCFCSTSKIVLYP